MATFDKNIQDKLKDRQIAPSASAWERMSEQLDVLDSRKRRRKLWYFGYAASIALLLSAYFLISQTDDKEDVIREDVFVKQEVRKPVFMPEKILETKPIQELVLNEQLVVALEPVAIPLIDTEKTINPEFAARKETLRIARLDTVGVQNKFNASDASEMRKEIKKAIRPKAVKASSIVVDSDALLFAVTNKQEDINRFYKKYVIARQDALKEVQRQLKQTNLSVAPETILAQVEMDLVEESFQNNFFKNFKKRVSDVIAFISSRND